MINAKLSRVRKLLVAFLLAVGLVFLVSNRLGTEASNRVGVFAQQSTPLVEQATVALMPDARVAALMQQITTDTLVAYERALTGEEPVAIGGEPFTIRTRYSYSGEPISKATQYVFELFQGLGLDVTFHEYTYLGNHWRNVVAERQGHRRPEEIYLITAHLDDLPSGSIAPGADDNASGSTAVLMAAALLSGFDCDYTLRFVLFTGEEQGLRGSDAYADAVAADGENIKGVLNLDMIGYNSDASPIIDLHARSAIPTSVDIAETFSQVVAVYDLNLTADILVDHWLGNYSDNRSFWDHGYPAILAIEDYDDFNPNYHSVDDTLANLDLEYFTEFVRAGIGTLVHMSCLSTGLLTGTVTALDTGAPLSATVTAIALPHVYTTTTHDNGYYTLSLPLLTYTVRAYADPTAYMPAVVTDVVVVAGQTVVRHLVLEPWRHQVFVPTVLKQP